MIKKILVLSLFIVSLMLIAGCTSGDDGFTADEREVLGQEESALAGRATDMGCRTYGQTTYSCAETSTGVRLTYGTRSFSLLDGCKLTGTTVYDYSCPSDGRGYITCRTSCTEGCDEAQAEGQLVCDEDLASCSDSDGGLTYDTQGSVTVGGYVTEDLCTTGLGGVVTTESSEFLMEEFCTGEDTESGAGYQCPYGCIDGACQPPCSPDGGYRTSADGLSVESCTSGRWVAASCVGEASCGNGVVDAGETCETCAADAGACPVAEFCVNPSPSTTDRYAPSYVCTGGTALGSNLCKASDPSNCCRLQSSTNSCDGDFAINHTVVDCDGDGVSEEGRDVRIDCTELALVQGSTGQSPINTCVSTRSFNTCAPCGATICQSNTWDYAYISSSGTCTSGYTSYVVTGGVCDSLTVQSCTDTDTGNNPIVAGSATITLSDGRTNTVTDSCVVSPLGYTSHIEYSCDATSGLIKQSSNCDLATGSCVAGACLPHKSCVDDGANSLTVKNYVDLTLHDDTVQRVEDRCMSTQYVYQVSCGTGTAANMYTETGALCPSGKTCSNGACI